MAELELVGEHRLRPRRRWSPASWSCVLCGLTVDAPELAARSSCRAWVRRRVGFEWPPKRLHEQRPRYRKGHARDTGPLEHAVRTR